MYGSTRGRCYTPRIRYRAGADEGMDFHLPAGTHWPADEQAREDGIRDFDLALELADLGATFAVLTKNDPLAVAARIEKQIMAEPDEEDEEDEEDETRD